jgi:hypothetical protein
MARAPSSVAHSDSALMSLALSTTSTRSSVTRSLVMVGGVGGFH